MSMPDRDLDPSEALRAEREAELEAELAADVAVVDENGDLEADNAEVDGSGDLEADPVAERRAAGGAAAARPGTDEPELAIALSPRQILGGFALLAAILVWLFRRRRK
jgi:hypothetical protein